MSFGRRGDGHAAHDRRQADEQRERRLSAGIIRAQQDLRDAQEAIGRHAARHLGRS